MSLLPALSRLRYPGKYRVFNLLDRLGALSGDIHHKIGPYSCTVPADQFHFWRIGGPRNYQIRRIQRFAECLNALDEPFDFFDLGADIGAVSLQIRRFCPRLSRIIAVEPNPKAFPYLREFLAGLDVKTEIINAAVSNFDGTARFIFDFRKRSDHGGHLGSSGGEEVKVVTVDFIAGDHARAIALKVDVEGAESAVFEGARKTLAASTSTLLFLEIEPGVVKRSEIPPEAIFETAESIRPFSWRLADEGTAAVDRGRSFFDQSPSDHQYDLIGASV